MTIPIIPPPSQDVVDSVAAKVTERLSQTPYACSSLEQLDTRPSNFVYRGRLIHPISSKDGAATTTVIVRHATDVFDPRRHAFEQFLYNALAEASPVLSPSPSVVIKACPRMYLFEVDPFNIQVIEDFEDTTAVKSTVFSPHADRLLPQPDTPATLGHHLGAWLRAFHTWASAPDQQSLRAQVLRDGDPERIRKRNITYADFVTIMETFFPQVLHGHRQTLEEVSRIFCVEFEKEPILEGGDECWGIIHADTWTGNFLLPNTGWKASPSPSEPNRLFIIDWEYAQWGHRSIDLGQLIGDLSERLLFHRVETSMSVVQGIIQGYGRVSEEMAFRTAIHAGVHVIRAIKRNRPKIGQGWVPSEEKVAQGLIMARDWVLRGWAKDKEFFQKTLLAKLFGDD